MHSKGIDSGAVYPIFACVAGRNAHNFRTQPLIVAEEGHGRDLLLTTIAQKEDAMVEIFKYIPIC